MEIELMQRKSSKRVSSTRKSVTRSKRTQVRHRRQVRHKHGAIGRPRTYSTRVQVTLSREIAAAVQAWRKSQSGHLKLAAAVTELVAVGLAAKTPPAPQKAPERA